MVAADVGRVVGVDVDGGFVNVAVGTGRVEVSSGAEEGVSVSSAPGKPGCVSVADGALDASHATKVAKMTTRRSER
jgi:hypothetical protein